MGIPARTSGAGACTRRTPDAAAAARAAQPTSPEEDRMRRTRSPRMTPPLLTETWTGDAAAGW